MSRTMKGKSQNLIFISVILFFIGCTSIKTGNLTDSPLVNGNNNFVINNPNKSTTYNNTNIHYEITHHYETINQIDSITTYYENYERRLDNLLKDKKIKKKTYFEQKEKVQNLKNEAKRDRTRAEKALNEWQNLYRISSVDIEKGNKFINDSINLENQKRKLERKQQEGEARLAEERKNLAFDKKKLEESKIKPSNNPSTVTSKTLANGFVVGKNYCCNSDENLLYCIRSETISQNELSQIRRERDNNTYEEENDRTLIRCLEQGEQVQLVGEKGGWFQVYDAQSRKTGFISKKMDGGVISLTSCD